jgi:hypothetical protein
MVRPVTPRAMVGSTRRSTPGPTRPCRRSTPGSIAPPPPPVDAAVDDAPPPPPVDAGVDAPPPPPDAAAPTCPGGYVAVDGLASRYRVVTSQYRRWTGAEADCEDDGAGTHLVVLDSAAELALLDARLGEDVLGRRERPGQRGHLAHRHRAVPALLPWNSGEPNDILGEDCGEIARWRPQRPRLWGLPPLRV